MVNSDFNKYYFSNIKEKLEFYKNTSKIPIKTITMSQPRNRKNDGSDDYLFSYKSKEDKKQIIKPYKNTQFVVSITIEPEDENMFKLTKNIPGIISNGSLSLNLYNMNNIFYLFNNQKKLEDFEEIII